MSLSHGIVPGRDISDRILPSEVVSIGLKTGLSAFRQKVLLLCHAVPASKVTTYGAIANALGMPPGGARSVGQALKNNPFAPRVPCHRVVAANRQIGGFAGETDPKSAKIQKKVAMLEAEGVKVIRLEAKSSGKAATKPSAKVGAGAAGVYAVAPESVYSSFPAATVKRVNDIVSSVTQLESNPSPSKRRRREAPKQQHEHGAPAAASGETSAARNAGPFSVPADLRRAASRGDFTGPTCGHCNGYAQANLVILPQSSADDFRRFCQLNPKPCPLIEEVGPATNPEDLRAKLLIRKTEHSSICSAVPRYVLWRHGRKAAEGGAAEVAQWMRGGAGAGPGSSQAATGDSGIAPSASLSSSSSSSSSGPCSGAGASSSPSADGPAGAPGGSRGSSQTTSSSGAETSTGGQSNKWVGFLLGCSFSFEEALLRAGVPVRHVEAGCNVPMYRTTVQCTPSGPFRGPLVVSMRPMTEEQAELAVKVTSQFPRVHGAPVQVHGASKLGIADLSKPDYGDPVEVREGEVPVFWACGVTPQAALENAMLPVAITHKPGHMLVLDVKNAELAGDGVEGQLGSKRRRES